MFPRKPLGSGRSQFSKALPTPPEPPAPPPITKDKPVSMTSSVTSLHSTLPPIPKDSLPLAKMLMMSIPRRLAGASTTKHPEEGSTKSASSTYSSSPDFSRSLSDSSNKTKDSLDGIESEADLSPPLPPKDSKRKQTTTTLASPASGFQTSPPRPEIWRRRSIKSDRSIVFPELKLSKSNGSTTGPPQPPPDRELPAVPSQILRSTQGQKLLPARPAPPQPDFGGMGQKLSKLREKEKAKKGSESSSKNVQVQPQPQTYQPFLNKRLPTPEYLTRDKHQQPNIPHVLSPISPANSPTDEAPPAIPQKAESRSTSSLTVVPDTVLANTTNRLDLFSHSRDNSDTLPRPNLLSSHSRDTSETLTITSEAQVLRSPQPQTAYASKILTPTPSPPPTSPTKTLASPPAEKRQSLASPPAIISPSAKLNVRFPRPANPAPPGTIFQGPKLNIVHLKCYQNHNLMRHSKNVMCPVACMVCRKAEPGPRWRCTWCCLGACQVCMDVLTSIPGRDLRVCLERIEKMGEPGRAGEHSHKSSASGSWR